MEKAWERNKDESCMGQDDVMPSYCSIRSNPIPNPECGTVPNRRRSVYHSIRALVNPLASIRHCENSLK